MNSILHDILGVHRFLSKIIDYRNSECLVVHTLRDEEMDWSVTGRPSFVFDAAAEMDNISEKYLFIEFSFCKIDIAQKSHNFFEIDFLINHVFFRNSDMDCANCNKETDAPKLLAPINTYIVLSLYSPTWASA